MTSPEDELRDDPTPAGTVDSGPPVRNGAGPADQDDRGPAYRNEPGRAEPDEEFSAYRDDRDLWEGPQDGPKAIKLIQGYVWHPREQELGLDSRLSAELSPGIHLLVDAMPQAPFTFFEDGTMSATQQVYQLTVVAIVEPGNDPGKLLPAVAERLQALLDKTPPAVGWQLMEDLREVG